ncbi:hypothetical protein [Propioniciclava flava]
MSKPTAEAVASGDVAVGEGKWTAVHHAFTSPKPESLATFDTDPGSALSYGYDFVANGNEVGGGSIPYPSPRRPRAGLCRHGHGPSGGAGEVRLPAGRLHHQSFFFFFFSPTGPSQKKKKKKKNTPWLRFPFYS